MEELLVLSAEIKPTPKPAKKRPATNNGMAVEAVWRMTPKQNTRTVIIKAIRRPIKSPRGAANKAPKKVPADRMDTIREDWADVMSGRPVKGFV